MIILLLSIALLIGLLLIVSGHLIAIEKKEKAESVKEPVKEDEKYVPVKSTYERKKEMTFSINLKNILDDLNRYGIRYILEKNKIVFQNNEFGINYIKVHDNNDFDSSYSFYFDGDLGVSLDFFSPQRLNIVKKLLDLRDSSNDVKVNNSLDYHLMLKYDNHIFGINLRGFPETIEPYGNQIDIFKVKVTNIVDDIKRIGDLIDTTYIDLEEWVMDNKEINGFELVYSNRKVTAHKLSSLEFDIDLFNHIVTVSRNGLTLETIHIKSLKDVVDTIKERLTYLN